MEIRPVCCVAIHCGCGFVGAVDFFSDCFAGWEICLSVMCDCGRSICIGRAWREKPERSMKRSSLSEKHLKVSLIVWSAVELGFYVFIYDWNGG